MGGKTGAALCALLVLGLGGPARAEQAVSLREAAELLGSNNEAAVRRGIAAYRASKAPTATLALAKRIRAGLTPPLLDAALDAFAELPRGPGTPVLIELATHRSAKVRARALEIAALQKAPGAQPALVAALDDGEASVRRAAVAGLVALKARASVPTLLVALERGVPEAAEAVGTLAGPGHVPRLVALLDTLPFTSVEPALRALLGRRDVPVPAKVSLLERLGTLESPDVALFLSGLVAGLPQTGRDPVRQAAVAALEEHGGSAPAGGASDAADPGAPAAAGPSAGAGPAPPARAAPPPAASPARPAPPARAAPPAAAPAGPAAGPGRSAPSGRAAPPGAAPPPASGSAGAGAPAAGAAPPAAPAPEGGQP